MIKWGRLFDFVDYLQREPGGLILSPLWSLYYLIILGSLFAVFMITEVG